MIDQEIGVVVELVALAVAMLLQRETGLLVAFGVELVVAVVVAVAEAHRQRLSQIRRRQCLPQLNHRRQVRQQLEFLALAFAVPDQTGAG